VTPPWTDQEPITAETSPARLRENLAEARAQLLWIQAILDSQPVDAFALAFPLVARVKRASRFVPSSRV
jgi:hypothetical protein